MLICNYELRINTESPGSLSEDEAEVLRKEMDFKVRQLVDNINRDDRVHAALTEV